VLGRNESEKILNTSIILLAVIDDIHGISTVKTSDLNAMIEQSELNSGNFANIGREDNVDVYLTRRGKGQSDTTKISVFGKTRCLQSHPRTNQSSAPGRHR